MKEFNGFYRTSLFLGLLVLFQLGFKPLHVQFGLFLVLLLCPFLLFVFILGFFFILFYFFYFYFILFLFGFLVFGKLVLFYFINKNFCFFVFYFFLKKIYQQSQCYIALSRFINEIFFNQRRIIKKLVIHINLSWILAAIWYLPFSSHISCNVVIISFRGFKALVWR